MSEPQQQFVAGDARRLPGGLAVSGYRASGLPEGVHLGVPSATLTVVLSLDGPVVVADTASDLRAGRAASLDVVVAGLQSTATHVAQPSHQEGVQLAIDPLAARALFGVPAAELAASATELFEPGPWARELWHALGETASWQHRFDLVAGALATRAEAATAAPDPAAAAAWRLLRRSGGAVPMDTVAHEVGLCGRALRTRFRREFGIGPKQAARLMRFDRALTTLTTATRAGRPLSLARVAADCGYADHAHLTREFRGYLEQSPTSWLAHESRNIQAGGHTRGPEWSA